jgi:hypothetical protein
MDLGSRDGIVVVSVHQHNPPDPSVPPLFATTKPAGFQLNGFRRNRNADSLPDFDCVASRKGSLPTHAQIGSFANANPQRRSSQSFRPGDDDSR